MRFEEKVRAITEQYRHIQGDDRAGRTAMPARTCFIDDHQVLSLPREDGDNRYPFGQDGFNFWAYASGYMHANEGLFSTFLRAADGQEPLVAFFAGLPRPAGGYDPVPLLPVPRCDLDEEWGIERYTVFSSQAAYYFTGWPGWRFVVRAFVTDLKEICFTVQANNLGEAARRLYLSFYVNPLLRHDLTENGEQRWYKEARYVEQPDWRLGSFVIRVNEDLSRTLSVSNYGIVHRHMVMGPGSRLLDQEFTTSRYQYVGGSRSSLHTPLALRRGTFGAPRPVCAFTEVGIAGDLLHIELGAQAAIRVDTQLWQLRHCGDETAARALLDRRIDPAATDETLDRLEARDRERQQGLTAVVGPAREGPVDGAVFNSFFVHLKKQVEFCSLLKGYAQLAPLSLIGIRDVFQALEAYLAWQPEAARAKMLEALNYVMTNGRCPRQYSLPVAPGAAPVMDLRPFIDQGAWVISAVVTYLRTTGDFGFLQESCGYYQIVDEKTRLVALSGERDTVLEHLFRIVDYLAANLDETTHCLRALYGDWNDALDGLGVSRDPGREYGSGVSVMASLQFYQNLGEMIDLLQHLDAARYEPQLAGYRELRAVLQSGLQQYAIVRNERGDARIVHGWGDGRSYLVGSFDDVDRQPRYGLTSNAFWVLSQLYDVDPRVRPAILESFAVLDSKYGLKTFAPHFEPQTPGVGRIPKLPAGTAENGAVYIHATIFGIMALFRMGCPRQAWEQLYKVLPFTHERLNCSPYVVPNSYGCNPGKAIDGEAMLDWQTGSSNTLLKTLLRFVFGVEPHFDGVWIQPAAWMPFGNVEVALNIRGCAISLRVEQTGRDRRTFEVDGCPRAGEHDPVMGIEKLWLPLADLNGKKLTITVRD
jgi:hypothetical protein